MNIGILVDGEAEFHSLKLLYPRISTPAQLLNPLKCDMQPFAPPGQIALVAFKSAKILLLTRNVARIVVLLDKESRHECAGRFAREVEQRLNRRLREEGFPEIAKVVLKVKCYENWLIADPDAINELTGMFQHPERIASRVLPNRADNQDAIRLMKNCLRNRTLDKVPAAISICQRLDPDRAAQNSRSLRRFMRLIGHPDYRGQSRRPKV